MDMHEILAAFDRADYADACRLTADILMKQGGIDLIHMMGLSLIKLNRVEDGIAFLSAAITFEPTSTHIYTNAINIVRDLDVKAAIMFADKGVKQYPHDVGLLYLLQSLYHEVGNNELAVETLYRLIEIKPDDPALHVNLANNLRLLMKFDDAEKHFEIAEHLGSDDASLMVGRAIMYHDIGRYDEAVAMLHRIDNWDAEFCLSLQLLAGGDYRTGFSLYRNRWHASAYRKITAPVRECQHLGLIKGKRIAVIREGGYGDVFQFVRYLSPLAEIASEIVFHAMPSDVDLLRYNLPANVEYDRGRPAGDDLYDYDVASDCVYIIPLMNLPYLFKTTVDTVPPPLRFQVPPQAIERNLLRPTDRKRVGLTWAGGPQTGFNSRPYDKFRSLELMTLSGLSSFDNEIEFVNLQFGSRTNDPGLRTTHVLHNESSWMDTAAIIEQLDMVITVDTSIVHLAASMGKPTWLLSRFNACWRWLRNRPDNPWYPTVRVFGQKTFGDWSHVITDVHDALQVYLAAPTLNSGQQEVVTHG